MPDLKLTPDADWAAEVWADIIAELQPDQITVVTDENGKVPFVAAR
ncbi:hypothetical protein [Microvirga vignae]|nr:hypothetical protein [Microvirga vignae]